MDKNSPDDVEMADDAQETLDADAGPDLDSAKASEQPYHSVAATNKRQREPSPTRTASLVAQQLQQLPARYKRLEVAFSAVDAVLATAGFRALLPMAKLLDGAEHIASQLRITPEDVTRIHAIWPDAFILVRPAGGGGGGELFVRAVCRFVSAEVRKQRACEFHNRLLARALADRNAWASSRGLARVDSLDDLERWDDGFDLPATLDIAPQQPRLRPVLRARPSKPQSLLPTPPSSSQAGSGGIAGVIERVKELQTERASACEAIATAKRAGIVERLPLFVISLRQMFAAEHRTRVSLAEACEKLSEVLVPRLSVSQVRARIELLCRTAPEIVSIVAPPSPIPDSFRKQQGADECDSNAWISWPEKLLPDALRALQQRLISDPSLFDGLVL